MTVIAFPNCDKMLILEQPSPLFHDSEVLFKKQIPKVELLCDTGAQVDCLNRKKLHALGLGENQLLSPEVVVGCANESPAGVMGVFFGKVTAMEGSTKVQVQVLFYVLRDGGNILSRHTCEKLGIISREFPKVGEHMV